MRDCMIVAALVLSVCPAAVAAGPVAHEVQIDLAPGYDSNAFLAPDDPYYDQNKEEIVDPVQETGFFFHTRVDGDLERTIGESRSGFVLDYRLKADLYPDSDTSNADETYARLAPGLRFRLGESMGRARFLDVRVFGAYKEDIYFDRDTGLGTVSGSDEVDVSDRFTYDSIGASLDFEYELSSAFELRLAVETEDRDYEDPATEDVDSFDHDRLEVSGGFTVKLSKAVRGYADYTYEAREYSDRHARSLDGDDEVTNPLLEYVYDTLDVGLQLRPARPWTIDLRWSSKHRSDEYLDYNEYDQETLRVRSTFKNERMRLRLTAKSWDREFDRAFIFDDPIDPQDGEPNPLKDYETLELDLDAHFTWKPHVGPFVRVEYTDQESADPRFEYDRAQVFAGFELTY